MTTFTTNTAGNPFLTRAYGLNSVNDTRALYDDWATLFDNDMASEQQGYVAPALTVKAVMQALLPTESNNKMTPQSPPQSHHLSVLDAGCGTGLVGVAFTKLAAPGGLTIDGVDLSPKMLDVARKANIYRDLETADLSKPIAKPDATYDVVTCVGTLTHGHVGPVPALKEFVRIVKSRGGVVAATVLDDIWVSGGYETEVERLKVEGTVDLVSNDIVDYRKGAGVKARMLVLRKK